MRDVIYRMLERYRPLNPDPKQTPIRLKGAAYSKLKREVYQRDGGRCVDCRRWVPLTVNGMFVPYRCAHLAHIKSRGAGGEDTMDNVRILCHSCHVENMHGPQWSNKKR